VNHRAQSWLIAGIACLGGIGGGTVFPILPVIGLQLGISGVIVGVILSANRVTRLAFNPVTGWLVDRLGPKWPVAAGLAIEALGTLCFAVALSADHPAGWFLFGRCVWGVGSSLLLVGAVAGVLRIAEPNVRGRLTARVRSAISLGLPAGLALGGLTASIGSDLLAFWLATALTLLGAVAAACGFPTDSQGADRTAGRNNDAQASAVTWRQVLTIPTLQIIWSVNALLFFAVSGVFLATFSVMLAARDIDLFGLGPEGSAGLLMAVLMVARAGASLASGRYLDVSTSRTRTLMPAMALVAAGFVGLGFADDKPLLTLALAAIGVGAGAMTIPLLTLLGDVAPPSAYGRALSVYQLSSDVGGSLGPAVGLVLGHEFGFTWTYGAVGLLMLLMIGPLRTLARQA